MRKCFVLSLLFVSLPLWAKSSNYGGDRIKKMSWEGVEVVWLQDERFPTYTMKVYFADGALGDGRHAGLTHAMFELLSAGTRRFNQKQIADNLEYFAVSHWGSVEHELSTYTISGTSEHIVPTVKKICHIFKDATFPAKQLSNYKKQVRSNKKSLVNNHGRLANWVFYDISMSGTAYRNPVTGKLKNLKGISRKRLKRRLTHFNGKVKKRIYLYGSKKVLAIQNIILEECGWGSQARFVRKVNNPKKKFPSSGPKIHLVTVPSANQTQIRVGRYLNKIEVGENERHKLMNSILAGGFSSVLMKELRVKRGWVYGVRSRSSLYARDYGRVTLGAATKNKNVVPLLKVVKSSLQDVMNGNFPGKDFKTMKESLIYKYPFRFELGERYLQQLMSMDHRGKSYSDLYRFPRRIRGLSLNQIEKFTQGMYDWKKQTIVILGPASLKKALKELGRVKVTNYKKYL